MNAQFIQEMASFWRTEAKTLRRRGAAGQAELLESCAADLDRLADEWESDPLTLQQAADESGYSADHLGRMIREGKIPNAGRTGAPRMDRGALPIKAGVVSRLSSRELDRTQIVRSAINAGD